MLMPLLAILAVVHGVAVLEDHPINCNDHNPKDSVVCEYNVNE